MRDEHRAAQLSLTCSNQLNVSVSKTMEKVKWWKDKCEELKWLNDAHRKQAIEIKEMQLKINEYKVLTEDMTKEYKETKLSMC